MALCGTLRGQSMPSVPGLCVAVARALASIAPTLCPSLIPSSEGDLLVYCLMLCTPLAGAQLRHGKKTKQQGVWGPNAF